MTDIQLIPFIYYAVSAVVSALLAFLFASLIQRRQLEQYQQDTQKEQQELGAELHRKEIEITRLQTELLVLREHIDSVSASLKDAQVHKENAISLEAKLHEQKGLLAQEKRLIEENRSRLFNEFELATNKLFEAKQQQFSSASKSNLEGVLAPFKEQLKAFNTRVEDVYHKENSQRNQLIGQIAELQKQTQQISSEANNLAAALKGDNKAQGNWGEIILERLLEQSGLQKGREYDTQKSHLDDSGKTFKPDVIVHLPEGKDIVVDAKVSLVNYEQYCKEQEPELKSKALKNHVDSLRAHIKGLSLKQYESLEGIRSLDFVFIFVPIEAAYISAIQAAPTIFNEAYDKNIVLVSPSSLMVALRTIETLWRYEKQNSNAEAIAQSAGKLYDQFVLFVTALEEIGNNIDKASKAHELACKRLSAGRGNLLNRVESLRTLGAKTSRAMPGKYKNEELLAASVDESLNDKAMIKNDTFSDHDFS
ncbi:DNA recombination protein RmuC [Alteromonadaceae bacterium Bs31]|nr:DNA recombination protein RmuC [Alteromonadaceae bacterium Bs31]